MKRPFASVGIPADAITPATRTRFLAKIEYGAWDACWPWIGSRTRQQYGRFTIPGYSGTTAQRVMYAIAHGSLPPGLTIDHRCGHPWCVNPTHLEAVPHAVNVARGRTSACAVNARKKTCPQGHAYETYFHKSSGRTQRYCPTCKREKGREWMRQHRAVLREAREEIAA